MTDSDPNGAEPGFIISDLDDVNDVDDGRGMCRGWRPRSSLTGSIPWASAQGMDPRMTDYVATRIGDRVRVKLSTGWTITYEDGAEQAQISAPGFQRATGAMSLPKSARSRAVVTVESLAAALVEGIRDSHPRVPGPFTDWAHLDQ